MSDKPKQFFNVVAIDPPEGYWSTKDPTVFHAHTLETTGVDLRGTEFKTPSIKTICGHERNALIWACGFTDGPEVNHCRKWASGEYAACEAVGAPAKLAELIASEARRCGTESFAVEPYGRKEYQNESVQVTDLERDGARIFPMPQARTILLALLQLPDGDREGAEKTLRGTT
jgi:hypothetical protein